MPEEATGAQVEASPEKAAAVIAMGTLQNLAAESNSSKEAIREAGGIPILVSLIQGCPDTEVSLFLPQTMHRITSLQPCQ